MSTGPEAVHTKQDWQTLEILKTPMEVAWQFDYAIGIDRLRNLYSKAKQAQWNSDTALDWDHEIDPSKPIVDQAQFGFDRLSVFQKLSDSQKETFTAHMTCQLLSQFLHGEQGAMMTAAVLTHEVPDYEAKLYAATQTMDEARHVEVYERYVGKLGIAYPMSPWLREVIDATLEADHWIKTAIGMNMIVEGLALAAFHNMRRQTTCPLLEQLTDLVLRDESRHVAFGNVYVGEGIRQLHPDELEDVAEFAFQAVKMMADSQGGVDGTGPRKPDPGFLGVLDATGIDLNDFIASLQEAKLDGIKAQVPAGQVHSFKDLMMPALVRVGAVTDRSRALFKEAGIPVWEDASVLEGLEDHDTGEFDFGEMEELNAARA